MPISAQQAHAAYAEAEQLYTADEVEAAVARMAEQISARLAGTDPLILCVMIGGLIPAGKLVPKLNFPLHLDYLHATRYRGETRGSDLHWIIKPRVPLRDRVVLVIDDILDEGLTLAAILEHCRAEGAREVYSAVLVEKLHDRRPAAIEADFVGLQVGDRYVFGYGMDYKDYWRNAPGIYAAKLGTDMKV
ncbi:MAG: hypoxanthine-guanine phosphoribosyltransferase [Gammaproteobacteria bacterium]|nr:hypoxanthine-guanine phosphoribosyltransferase [Gammaproteobacteria bacterium]